jgi:hypothetical protein
LDDPALNKGSWRSTGQFSSRGELNCRRIDGIQHCATGEELLHLSAVRELRGFLLMSRARSDGNERGFYAWRVACRQSAAQNLDL